MVFFPQINLDKIRKFLISRPQDSETTLHEEKCYEVLHSAVDKRFPSKDILTILSLTSEIRSRDSRDLKKEIFF